MLRHYLFVENFNFSIKFSDKSFKKIAILIHETQLMKDDLINFFNLFYQNNICQIFF